MCENGARRNNCDTARRGPNKTTDTRMMPAMSQERNTFAAIERRRSNDGRRTGQTQIVSCILTRMVNMHASNTQLIRIML